MAVKWLKLLDEKFPQLAMAARQLNEEDDFVMYTSKKDKKDKKDKKKKTSEKNNGSDTDDNDDDDDGETTHDRDCRDSDSIPHLKRSGSDDSSNKKSKYQRR